MKNGIRRETTTEHRADGDTLCKVHGESQALHSPTRAEMGEE